MRNITEAVRLLIKRVRQFFSIHQANKPDARFDPTDLAQRVREVGEW